MYKMDLLTKQIQVIYGRVLDLHQLSSPQVRLKPDVLPIALKELGLASEELQVAVEELERQNQVLSSAQLEAHAERLRYQSLFEFAPDALLITALSGTIQEVNRAAAELLKRHALYLIGKPITSLVCVDDRTEFRNTLARLNQRDTSTNRAELTARLAHGQQDGFAARLTVDVICNDQKKPLLLRWQIRDLSSCKAAIAALAQPSLLPSAPQSYEIYRRGEAIPLASQVIWLVAQGTVKLTSLSENGEEILMGLATEEQIFGASLTALSVYQAIALSDVKLVPISLSDSTHSTALSQALMPRIMQRLQQAERFLTMRGHLHVEERLNQFLRLLKDELGEAFPAETGGASKAKTRLKAKLTHQEFASACSTTRVTITRLLGQLQQRGKLEFDAQNHMVLKD